VFAAHPDLVLWQVGSNAVLLGRPIAPTGLLIDEGVRRLKAAGSDVVLIDPQYAPKVIARHDEHDVGWLHRQASGPRGCGSRDARDGTLGGRMSALGQKRTCALGSAQVQGAGGEFNVGPLQAAKLRNPQAVPEGHQEHCAVALAPAIALGGLDQLLDLTLGEVFAWPKFAVGAAGRCGNCPFYCRW
jgi:hypothetical protein